MGTNLAHQTAKSPSKQNNEQLMAQSDDLKAEGTINKISEEVVERSEVNETHQNDILESNTLNMTS